MALKVEIRQAFVPIPSLTYEGEIAVVKVPFFFSSAQSQEAKEQLLDKFIKKLKPHVNYKHSRPTMEEVYGIQFRDGETLEILSQKYTVQIESKEIERAYAKIEYDVLRIALPSDLKGTQQKQIISELGRKALSHEIKDSFEEYVHLLNRQYFGSPLGRITIRLQSSRWGSCSSENNLNFNFKLLFFPREILDYVIIHELAHTKVRDHSPSFWAQVIRGFPEYKKARKWLRTWMKERIRELKTERST